MAPRGELPGIIANIVYDKVLSLGDTPWSERSLKDYLKNKETDKEARKKPDVDRVLNTNPSTRWLIMQACMKTHHTAQW